MRSSHQERLVSNTHFPYYFNDRCQSWWITKRNIDLKIRGPRNVHASLKGQFGFTGMPINGANRDKMSISSISMADRINESLSIVFKWNLSPSSYERKLTVFIRHPHAPKMSINSNKNVWGRLTQKRFKVQINVLRIPSEDKAIKAYLPVIISLLERIFLSFFFTLCEKCNVKM